MSSIRSYILCVVATAMLCSMLLTLCAGTSHVGLLKVLCGLTISLVVLKPASSLDLSGFTPIPVSFLETGAGFAKEGTLSTQKSIGDIIKNQTEAYILDKAAALNAVLSVEVILDSENVPIGAILSGQISPYARQQLAHSLETELGIPKENQQWTG